ncbi:MAG: Holliday junction branch migration protein RuvA [Clostridiaceae bacterium]|jgi:Holliday junction DNA helicase RuvA|nr:Holliday junction branch migration protein RuvA [Clostridiaceae bacterium]
MYAYIKGRIDSRGKDYIVIEAGGIGYKVFAPLSTLEAAVQNQDFKVYTYLNVREDAMTLFGFATKEELAMFELLLTVSGIGPKAALAILSAVSPSQFGLAVITEDVKTLTGAQGIGPKLAKRVILELKDKISKEQLDMASGALGDKSIVPKEGSRLSEAISALVVLGYSPMEASKAVASVYSDELDLETIIKNSLKGLSL